MAQAYLHWNVLDIFRQTGYRLDRKKSQTRTWYTAVWYFVKWLELVQTWQKNPHPVCPLGYSLRRLVINHKFLNRSVQSYNENYEPCNNGLENTHKCITYVTRIGALMLNELQFLCQLPTITPMMLSPHTNPFTLTKCENSNVFSVCFLKMCKLKYICMKMC